MLQKDTDLYVYQRTGKSYGNKWTLYTWDVYSVDIEYSWLNLIWIRELTASTKLIVAVAGLCSMPVSARCCQHRRLNNRASAMSVVHVWLRQNYSDCICPFNQCLLSRGVWPVIIGQSGWPDDSRYRGLTRSTSLHACLSVRGRYAASSLMSDVTAWEQASKYDDRCRRRRQRRVSDAISTLVRSRKTVELTLREITFRWRLRGTIGLRLCASRELPNAELPGQIGYHVQQALPTW